MRTEPSIGQGEYQYLHKACITKITSTSITQSTMLLSRDYLATLDQRSNRAVSCGSNRTGSSEWLVEHKLLLRNQRKSKANISIWNTISSTWSERKFLGFVSEYSFRLIECETSSSDAQPIPFIYDDALTRRFSVSPIEIKEGNGKDDSFQFVYLPKFWKEK